MLGGTNTSIVSRSLAEHYHGAIGITNWIGFSLDLPVVYYSRNINPDTLAAATTERGLGDIQLSTKIRFLNRSKYFMGIAFAPFITLPTGNTANFMGEDGVTGGGSFIFDGETGKRFTWAINVGGLIRKKFSAYNLVFDEQFLLSGAASFRLFDFLSVATEVSTRTPFTDFFQDKDTSPTEIRSGLQWKIGKYKNFVVNTAGSFGIAYGTGVPHYGAFLSLTYKKKPSRRYVQKIKNMVEKTVYFDSDSFFISPEGSQTLKEIEDVLHDNTWIKHIELNGYADSFGNKKYNHSLSQKRAQAVYNYLKEHMPRQTHVSIFGFSEDNPIESNRTRQGRTNNRRVEIHIK